MWTAHSQYHQIKHGQKDKQAKHQFKNNTNHDPPQQTTPIKSTTSSSPTPTQKPQQPKNRTPCIQPNGRPPAI
jgi:hypothetical protein